MQSGTDEIMHGSCSTGTFNVWPSLGLEILQIGELKQNVILTLVAEPAGCVCVYIYVFVDVHVHLA